MLKKSKNNIVLWIVMIPICATAILCFYKGAFFSINWQDDQIEARIAQTRQDYNFGGELILLGWTVIISFSMVLFNFITHIIVGIKTFKGNFPDFHFSKMLWHQSDCKRTKKTKILSYGCTALYLGWLFYGFYQGNAYYIIWSVLAILVTHYYCWCIFMSIEPLRR